VVATAGAIAPADSDMVFGLCQTRKDTARDAQVTQQIDRTLRQDKKRLDREAKLLLLGEWHTSGWNERLTPRGAGESGKSTIIKQMRLLYAKGFSKNERDKYRFIIFANLVSAFNDVIEAMRLFKVSFETNEHEVGYICTCLNA
jgi:guanine nucleotide-binding protein subunit alpha